MQVLLLSPTAREVRESNEREALVVALEKTQYANLLDEHSPEYLPSGYVKLGPIEIRPGQNPDKPVIVDARTKRMMEGSGRPPKANDPVLVGKGTGYKNSTEYRKAFEALFPAGGDIDERGSLAWWFDQAWAAAEGSPQYVDCPHPDSHVDKSDGPLKHVVAFKKDAALIFRMIELAVGKAPQTINLNSKSEQIVQSLEYRVYDVTLHGIDEGEADRRRDLIAGFGYVVDVPAEESGTLSLPSGETASDGEAG